MRVGLVSHSGRALDAIGYNLAEKLAFFLERGADVRVFLQSAADLHPQLRGHVEVVAQAGRAGLAWQFLAGADLVVVEFAQHYELLHFLPLLVGGKPRLVVDYHGITPPELWTGPNSERLRDGLAWRGLVWYADAVIVHSRFMSDELHQATGLARERIRQLGLVVEPPAPMTPVAPPLEVSQAKALGDGRLLLFVGRLAGNKRVPVLIEALARLRDERPVIHAAIVGDHGDAYSMELQRCREAADRLGLSDRVHFLGRLSADDLESIYFRADALVAPSLHEGFCLPVVEAMAHGVPVIAARVTALPETVGDAGLTFTADDPDDLARQIERVLAPAELAVASGRRRRVAVVCFRFGGHIVGGAERSLRTVAQTLHKAGHTVEVFTTCTSAEGDWTNDLKAGTFAEDGLITHRFPIDQHDRPRHLESVRRILEADGCVDSDCESAYLEHSIHSRGLIDALAARVADFDAVIVGPYLFGLTWDVARSFPEKTLLVPCFHDEPLARLRQWPSVYGQVGGILYHSPEEQDYAQAVLGVNHPRAVEMGTWIDPAASDFPAQAGDSAAPGHGVRTLVYCGRYSAQKDVPRLLDYAERYEQAHPGRFRWLFLGQREVSLPRRNWICDMGRVSESCKRDTLAQADALVQLSRNESLSLVVLEAWAAGTPVIVDRACAVLRGQIERSAGGRAVADFAGFARALDDLWSDSNAWREHGRRGQAYMRERYGSEDRFVGCLLAAIDGLRRPLRAQMAERGRRRAQAFTRPAWRGAFGKLVESMLEAEPRPCQMEIVIEPYEKQYEAAPGTRRLLVPVRIENRGSHPACPDGPRRTSLLCEVLDLVSGRSAGPVEASPLVDLLMPGKVQSAALAVPVPMSPGEYRVRTWAASEGEVVSPRQATFELAVSTQTSVPRPSVTGPILEQARAALAEAHRMQRLPDDYLDVTLGRFARWKLWIKSKLLGNFKRGYVDVLSRQQSQVNQRLVAAVQQLAECCATLDSALRGLQAKLETEAHSEPESPADQTAADFACPALPRPRQCR